VLKIGFIPGIEGSIPTALLFKSFALSMSKATLGRGDRIVIQRTPRAADFMQSLPHR
jgi:hypothetical protein